jgi:hypothetical protein
VRDASLCGVNSQGFVPQPPRSRQTILSRNFVAKDYASMKTDFSTTCSVKTFPALRAFVRPFAVSPFRPIAVSPSYSP